VHMHRIITLNGLDLRSRSSISIFLILATVFALALRYLQPLYVQQSRRHDEGLFLTAGSALASGDWLGPVNSLVMAKGPGLSALVAISMLSQIPLVMIFYLGFIVAAALVSLALARIFHNSRIGIIAYLALIFLPTNFGTYGSMLIRENLYTSLAIGLVGISLLLVLSLCRPKMQRPVWLRLLGAAALATALGVVLACLFLVKEDRVMILPLFAPALLFGTVELGRSARCQENRWLLKVGLAVIVVTVCFGTFQAMITLVQKENKIRYGVGLTQDMTEGNFPQFVGELSRMPDVAVKRGLTRAQLDKAAEVSPEFAKVLPSINYEFWSALSCEHTNYCRSLSPAYATWALRDGVERAGLWKDATRAQELMREVSIDLSTYCSLVEDCSSGRSVLGISLESIDLQSLWSSTRAEIWSLLTLHQSFVQVPEKPIDDPRSRFVEEQRWDLWTLILNPSNISADRYMDLQDQRVRAVSVLLRISRFTYALLGIYAGWRFLRGFYRFLRGRAFVLKASCAPIVLGMGLIVASRVLELSFLDATTFPSVGVYYSLPTFPFLALTAVLAAFSWEKNTKIGIDRISTRR
jgi:hypothetical protein